MLLAWRKFVEIVDPDILTGYNIINFDIWYLLTRAQKLGLVDFPFWGRIKTQVLPELLPPCGPFGLPPPTHPPLSFSVPR